MFDVVGDDKYKYDDDATHRRGPDQRTERTTPINRKHTCDTDTNTSIARTPFRPFLSFILTDLVQLVELEDALGDALLQEPLRRRLVRRLGGVGFERGVGGTDH